MITSTGPQQQARRPYPSPARRGRRAAVWVAGLFLVAGVALIGLVARDVGAPSVFMSGIACLIISGLAILVAILFELYRGLMRKLGEVLVLLKDMRGKQDAELEIMQASAWSRQRRDNG